MYERNETEAIMQRIGRVRRSTGLSQAEFAKSLHVPVWQTVIAEYGVHFYGDHGSTAIIEQLFCGNEFAILLQRISREYGVPVNWLMHGEGEVSLHEADMPDDELTLYFPVVISSQTLLDDLKRLINLLRLDHFAEPERKTIEKDSLDPLFLKFKAYLICLTRMGKSEIAHAARKQILDFCNPK